MSWRVLGLFGLSVSSGFAAWAVGRSDLDSWSKGHALWPLVALSVVAAAAGIYLAVVGARRERQP